MKLFLFILLGFGLYKMQLLPKNTTDVLSKLTLWAFLPAMSFRGFCYNFNVHILKSSFQLLLISFLVLISVIAISRCIGKCLSKDLYTQTLCAYTIAVPNYGYMGYALVRALLGDEMLMKFQVFALPLTMYIYIFCINLLMGRSERNLRALLNPPIVALLLGIVCGLTGATPPVVVQSVLTTATNCVAPITMILAGCSIAQFHFKEMLANPLVYILVICRLILIPVVICAMIYLVEPSKEMALFLIMLYTLPTGLNTIVFPGLAGKDCRLGAGTALVSHIVCLATTPFFISLMM